MAKFSRNFIAGRMNKVTDERLIPDGEYIDAMNVRMGSTEKSEIGVIENTKGNLPLTQLAYRGTLLSVNARCIGALDDSANELIYWFVHDPTFTVGDTGKCDMVVSYNVFTDVLTYHLISIDDGGGVNTTLNFNPLYLITGVNVISNDNGQDLLFWTDYLNEPRFINVKRNYPSPNSVSNIDSFTNEQILVIKRPPNESPTVSLVRTAGQENFLQTRFISFAYRYRYEDGEYSATSQWSDIAFNSGPFEFSINSMLNEGMTNAFNTATIRYNSGGPLVKGIDLLFKESNNSVIRVIEKIDKANLGLADNNFYQYAFDNSKIFTILLPTELLRLYDNVPLLAKAQTVMGNRLMYGNYVEGFDLLDRNNNPVKFEYKAELINENLGESLIPDSTASSTYNIDSSISIPGSILNINLASFPLVSGANITIEATISHSAFTGSGPTAPPSPDFEIDFSFTLPQNYNSVYELATSPEFQEAIGTASNILPVWSANPADPLSCDGTTFTDVFNCFLPQNLGTTYSKYGSGISAINQPIEIITSPASSQIGLRLVAMQYVDDPNTIVNILYEYYRFSFAEAIYSLLGNPRSLHSNRGYEIGIVYMDEYGRSTTALVSPNNTVFVPCGNSAIQNKIQVTIPFTQVAPFWATKYKFVIKPDAANYEIIYSRFLTRNADTNETYFLLEGENIQKVQVGDRYIVKKDTAGPLSRCAYGTVLEKKEFSANSIFNGSTHISGIYMKMLPNNFDTLLPDNANLILSQATECAPMGNNYTTLTRTVNFETSPGVFEDLVIPAGSRIYIRIVWERAGKGGNCDRRGVVFEGKSFTVLRDYDNFKEWWDGDNIGTYIINNSYQMNPNNQFTQVIYDPALGVPGYDFGSVRMQFNRNTTNNRLVLQMTSGKACTGNNYPNSRKYCVTNTIEIYRAVGTMIFETFPTDAPPDIFYENNLSFGIDANGNHEGNIQNQDISTNTPAIIDTQFFNCFVYGNGVESYKIRDSLIGKSFNLGERVTSVSAQEFKRSERFADITYSGIFNAESNVNKLNEFNLGLINYKTLETSFGPIYILDARETDILVLQEEKISYVLSGKNLLSDSTGGGAVASVPEVLGTQIARTEKYGISFNPESYVQWGFNRFFTDVKRGAVLQLVGDSYSSEQLKVISEANMRTWFRDEFNASFNTQKLGGYDPYMDEYVLTTNDRDIFIDVGCLNCGSQVTTLTLNQTPPTSNKSKKYCVNLGPLVGNTTISWVVQVIQGGQFQVKATYNGNTVSSAFTTTAGSISFNKDEILITDVEIEIIYNTQILVLDIINECPLAEELRIIEIVVTALADGGKTLHTEYRYVNGSYTSPLQSNLVTFGPGPNQPIVSRYNSIIGFVGSGGFPPEGSQMTLISNRFTTDSYNFSPAEDKFRYLRTNVLYNNNPTDIATVLAASAVATPITGSGNVFSATFTVPPNTNGNILYLIWDFRDVVPMDLCYDATTIRDACCDCVFLERCPEDEGVIIKVTNNSTTQSAEVFFPQGTQENQVPISVELDPGEEVLLLMNGNSDPNSPAIIYTIISGNVTVERLDGCGIEDYLSYAEAVGLTP
jgi:hypothetical protein